MFNQSKIDELPPHEAASNTSRPLDGIRVLDFTHFVAGPLSTLILSDFGADVIKVEPPDRGEDMRYYPPLDEEIPAQGGAFLWANRNKRSLAVDLKSIQGLQVVRDLITQADVLVENFSANVMSRLGLGYEECNKLNPRLIIARFPLTGGAVHSPTALVSTQSSKPRAVSCR